MVTVTAAIPGLPVVLDPMEPLERDTRKAAATLSAHEARFLVDAYYIIQEDRKRSGLQLRDLAKVEEPNQVLNWFFETNKRLEANLQKCLQYYADAQPTSIWSQTITGIGPVISAGLLANIDMSKTPSVSALWSFAGLDPTKVWEKKTKRPWNAHLKTLCWKAGESFVKFQNHPKDNYGHFYVERKELEVQRNEAGEFADQAAIGLKRVGKDTEAAVWYAQGKLPPGHIHARAKRWTVKLFLSHWWSVAYYYHTGNQAPRPYVFDHLHHVHYIDIPNWPMG